MGEKEGRDFNKSVYVGLLKELGLIMKALRSLATQKFL